LEIRIGDFKSLDNKRFTEGVRFPYGLLKTLKYQVKQRKLLK